MDIPASGQVLKFSRNSPPSSQICVVGGDNDNKGNVKKSDKRRNTRT
jgi:hypothetical protein